MLTHFTVSLSQFCAHVYCAHNFVLKKKKKECVYIYKYIKKKCKIYIVWGQYLSKVLEHICLTFWVQFTEMKWPSPVDILHLQHLLMLEIWGTQHLAKSGPNYAARGWGETVLSWDEVFLRQISIFTPANVFVIFCDWSISHRCQFELNWALAS